MDQEIQALSTNQTWDIVDLPPGKSPIGCKWVYKIKFKVDGSVERYKARLVAKGYTKKGGIDYKETFSQVSKKYSLRIVLTLVANYDLELHQIDVKTVFLNLELK